MGEREELTKRTAVMIPEIPHSPWKRSEKATWASKNLGKGRKGQEVSVASRSNSYSRFRSSHVRTTERGIVVTRHSPVPETESKDGDEEEVGDGPERREQERVDGVHLGLPEEEDDEKESADDNRSDGSGVAPASDCVGTR